MINSTHIQPKLSDYALGLLSPDERRSVEQHTHQCPDCETALQAELRLSQTVRTTLQTATHISNGRLQRLMPTVPQPSARRWRLAGQRQLASVCVLLILFLGSMGMYQARNAPVPAGIPTLLAITATNTQAPTSTAVITQTNAAPTLTAVAVEPVFKVSVPPPAATPIVAVQTSSN
jgi:anti-sigma factor RsiW